MMTRRQFTVGLVSGLGAVLVAGLLVGTIPVTGFEGVDGKVVVHRLSLWEKAAKFYLRHVEFERWAKEAAGGETDPQRRVLRLMDWTIKNVRHITPDLPFIDDHISYIVLRHYGNCGQQAEVFTALTTYTGNEGRWNWAKSPKKDGKRAVCLSFVESERGWWVLDVWNGGWFETAESRIATVQDFQHPEALRQRGQAPAILDGAPYRDYFRNLDQIWRESFSRARGQMPWHRLLVELGLEPDDSDWSSPEAS
jgi:hypothetical protein